MLQKKICMLGSFAVGKSSLTRRFVDNIFSDVYRTTLGVKIDKKVVGDASDALTMIVWDVQGDDHEQRVVPGYLRGMAGYLLVVDPTRPDTVQTAMELRDRVQLVVGDIPWVLVINKSDLYASWTADPATLAALGADSVAMIETSAKTGDGVQASFTTLATALRQPQSPQPA